MNPAPPPDANLATFLTNLPDLAGITREDGAFEWVNPRFVEVLGYTYEDLATLTLPELLHPEDLVTSSTTSGRMRVGRESVLFVSRFRTATDTWRWLEWSPLHAPLEPERLYFLARDVTEEREALSSLAVEQQKLRMAESLLGAGHWHVDLITRKLTWSDQIYRILGYPPNAFEPTIEKALGLYASPVRERVLSAIRVASREGRPFEIELKIPRADEVDRLCRVVGHPEHDDVGTIIGVFGIIRDLTDDAAHQRARQQEQLAYMAAHDLKQPIRTLRSYTQLLEMSLPTPTEEQRGYLSRIDAACMRAARRIDGMLQLARAEVTRPCGPLGIQQVLERVLDDLDRSLREAEAVVTYLDLPTVVANEESLYEILLNLVSNAIRFRGDAPARITVTTEDRGNRRILKVRDEGIGFDANHAETIFHPFRRLDTNTQGTGIGLAIVQRCAEKCGASVRAISRVGEGATFEVSFEQP